MMKHTVRYAPFFLPLLLLMSIGCSSQEAVQEHAFEVVSENGIPTALTTGGPRYAGDLFTYEPILTIREDEEEPDSMMKEMVQPFYGPDGRYYFLDVNGGRIIVFDGDGAFAGTIGRPGEGPGELRFPFRLSFHGGMVNISHNMTPRLSRFTMDGTFERQYSAERPTGYNIVPLLDVSADGRLLLTHYPSEQTEERISAAAAITVMRAPGDTLASLQTDPETGERGWLVYAIRPAVEGFEYP
ncbi:MAG: 6-bladed beta-propeller [bacterium]